MDPNFIFALLFQLGLIALLIFAWRRSTKPEDESENSEKK